jgi:hypothetical protein
MAKSDKSDYIDDTPHDPSDPPVEVMTPEKVARLDELRRMAALAPLDEAAAAELAALERSPLPPGPTDEEAARMAELRAAQTAGQITDKDKTELDALAVKEADAAGHVRPEIAVAAAPIDPTHAMIGDVLAFLESIVDTVPMLGSMRGRINMLKAGFARLIAPKP